MVTTESPLLSVLVKVAAMPFASDRETPDASDDCLIGRENLKLMTGLLLIPALSPKERLLIVDKAKVTCAGGCGGAGGGFTGSFLQEKEAMIKTSK